MKGSWWSKAARVLLQLAALAQPKRGCFRSIRRTAAADRDESIGLMSKCETLHRCDGIDRRMFGNFAKLGNLQTFDRRAHLGIERRAGGILTRQQDRALDPQFSHFAPKLRQCSRLKHRLGARAAMDKIRDHDACPASASRSGR